MDRSGGTDKDIKVRIGKARTAFNMLKKYGMPLRYQNSQRSGFSTSSYNLSSFTEPKRTKQISRKFRRGKYILLNRRYPITFVL